MEVINDEINTTICIWDQVFNTTEINPIPDDFVKRFLTAFSPVLFISLWFWRNTRIKDKLKELATDDSYRLFRAFVCVLHVREFAPKASRFFLNISFEVTAVFETFLDIAQIELLTHLCIERYVVSKYTSKGWPIDRKHYYLYYGLCIFFPLIYSIPPYYGLGGYALDFDCTTYSLDMILPNDWTRYFILAIWILRSVKPAVFIVSMLIWAKSLERYCRDKKIIKAQSYYTRLVEIVSAACCVGWLPMAVIRGSVIVSQLMFEGDVQDYTYYLSRQYIDLAGSFYEMTPYLINTTLWMAVNGLHALKEIEEDLNAPEEDDEKEE